MKKVAVLSLVLILLMPLMYTVNSITLDDSRGVLFDSLYDYTNIEYYNNCSIDNGTFVVDYGTENHTYIPRDSGCNAYEKRDLVPFFFIIPFLNRDIGIDFNSSQINATSFKNDGKAVTTISSSSYFVPLHHFRFYTSFSSNEISQITILWNGSFNSNTLKLYLWDYSARDGKGMWKHIRDLTETGENVVSVTSSEYVGDSGYIDILLIPSLKSIYQSTEIVTDYISIKLEAVQYRSDAFFVTKPISPAAIWRWESVIWNGANPDGTEIRCQILDENGSVIDSIRGNERGFRVSPLNLCMLSGKTYKKIRLKFYLDTDDYRRAPVLSDYTVLWQRENRKWIDDLSTDYRVEERKDDHIISIPINLPAGFWWDRFQASYDGQVTFKILDKSGETLINNIESGSDISSLCTRVIKLCAILENDTAQVHSWNITFKKERRNPEFSGFDSPWINSPRVKFSINARDEDSGLFPSSAMYRIEYRKNNSIVVFNSSWLPAHYTGENCSEEIQIHTPELPVFYTPALEDLLNLHGEKNITIYAVQFYVEDMAGNSAYSERFRVYMDTNPPDSYLLESSNELGFRHGYENITLTAWAEDDKTGISEVALYFSYSSDNTSFTEPQVYGIDDTPPWEWTFTPDESGYYRFFSLATDNAGNRENSKDGEISLLFDIHNPSSPHFDRKVLWLTSRYISGVRFEDDMGLSTIKYRLKNEHIWHEIAENIDSKTYNKSWALSDMDWETMEEGMQYVVYFNITDIVGNRYVTKDDSDTLIIAKDTRFPVAHIDKVKTWQWSSPFEITTYVSDVGSGIEKVSLYYQYSKDNRTWSEWKLYGTINESGEHTWEFPASEKDGYYRFYLEVIDHAGNAKTSEYVVAGITSFPSVYVIVLIVLIIAMIAAIFVFVKA